MSKPDPRLTLIKGDLAAASLEGVVVAARYRETQARRCIDPAAAVRDRPDRTGEQMTQLLFGEGFEVLEEAGGYAFGRGRRDGYVGYVETASLGHPGGMATHWVKALRTYAFAEPDIKSSALALISMNAVVVVEEETRKFAKLEGAGWVFKPHLAQMGEAADDWVAVCEQFLGAPYQWGGRESLGVDCSGLVQAGLQASGQACPRDSDMQFAGLGAAIDGTSLRRGDLVFWKGHVGVMADGARLLHANGHHMATALEPLAEAVERIGRTPTGMPTGYRRL